jgi:hypothetical protein
MSDEPTFICVDCGCPVYDALGQVRKRCLTCQWLAEISDPVDREALRKLLDSPVVWRPAP